jgi:hypothetical protein
LIEGYKDAADILAKACLAEEGANYPLIYPMVFCYRHALELMLKYVVNEYGETTGEKLASMDHKLLDLWRSARRVIQDFVSNEVFLTKIDRYIEEVASMDPASATFRYASDQKNKIYPMSVYFVDVRDVKATMNALLEFFDCVAFGMANSIST